MAAAPFVLAGSVAAGLALAAAVAIFAPLLAALIWRRRTGAAWTVFGAGALVFFVSQGVLRIPWQALLAKWVHQQGDSRPGLQLGFIVFSSFTAGLFEETGRYVGYRKLVKTTRDLRGGVMYGLGHGGIESILLVGLSLAGLLVAGVLASMGKIPPGPAYDGITKQLGGMSFGLALLGGVERLSALAVHVGLSLVVLQAFNRGGAKWVLLSIALHTAVNTFGVLAAKHSSGAVAELAIAAMAAAILITGVRLQRGRERFAGAPAGPTFEAGQAS